MQYINLKPKGSGNSNSYKRKSYAVLGIYSAVISATLYGLILIKNEVDDLKKEMKDMKIAVTTLARGLEFYINNLPEDESRLTKENRAEIAGGVEKILMESELLREMKLNKPLELDFEIKHFE